MKDTDELFSSLSNKKIAIELTSDQQKELDYAIEKITSNPNLTDKEKSDKCMRLIWETENEILKNQCDGEISLDQYGNFEFKIYDQEEEVQNDGISITYLT